MAPQLQSTPLEAWLKHGHQGKLSTTILDRNDNPSPCTPRDSIDKAPRWQRQLWRGRNFFDSDLKNIIDRLNNNDLRVFGDGSVRDQLGSFAFCFANKQGRRPFFTCSGPVDGHRHHMKALRAESTHVLAAVSLLTAFEPHVDAQDVDILVHSDCKTLINRLQSRYIIKPSLVLGDHMDLIYQIRDLTATSRFNFKFVFTQAIKEEETSQRSDEEQLLQNMHVRAYGYFVNETFVVPRSFSDYMPGSQISLVANTKPIVSNIGMTLQSLERQKICEEYFKNRLNIHEKMLDHIDTYTLGRVFQKAPRRKPMYSKIIHSQLNTMVVNERWSASSDKCPVYLRCREENQHHLVCPSEDMSRKRDGLLRNFEMDPQYFNTYPPLLEFIIEFFENLHNGE